MRSAFRKFIAANYPRDLSESSGQSREKAEERYRSLLAGWAGAKADCRSAESGEVRLARAPGRINLIGEHTDYNGCPVLPMAIDRDFIAAFAPLEHPVVEVTDAAKPELGTRVFRLEERIEPYATGDWGNYLKAAAQGVVGLRKGGRPLRGVRVRMHGSIPPSAGLSSSSALVVLSAVVLLDVNGLSVPRAELAAILAEAERYVGTQGGGMDQAVCLMGRAGFALKMDFFPLSVDPVPVPGDYTFVAAHSLVKSEKTGAAMDRYNLRAAECRLATALIQAALRRKAGVAVPIRRFGDLREGFLPLGRAEIRGIAGSALRREPYSLESVAALLKLGPEETARRFCRRKDGSLLTEPPDGFKLEMRYRHVISEWDRVEEARRALEGGRMRRFGELMNQSHASCRDDYEISCPELERLTALARKAGALGSRLTGAGFGGCTISLVPADAVERFKASLEETYYRDYARLNQIDDVLFACRAVDGAGILPAAE